MSIEWDYWDHSQARGEERGGFIFIIAYDGKLWGEFKVDKRKKNDRGGYSYYKQPGKVFLYDPPVAYENIVGQVRFPEGISKERYYDFLSSGKTHKRRP